MTRLLVVGLDGGTDSVIGLPDANLTNIAAVRADMVLAEALLDATTPYMLWSDECRIRCRSHLYGLLCQPEKQLAS